jgi:hypothetical protein
LLRQFDWMKGNGNWRAAAQVVEYERTIQSLSSTISTPRPAISHAELAIAAVLELAIT